jgi:hypothetical protein
MIHRFNIVRNDVFRGINDTTSSALATGKMISGGRTPAIKGTTCNMHQQELVVQHALGLRGRTKNKQIVDSFDKGKNLRDKCKVFVSKLMNKKTKNLFKKYQTYCKDVLHCATNRLEIPNDTRVSGVFRMYESLLRSKHALTKFCTLSDEKEKFKDILLSDEDWKFLAQTYSILQVMNVVAMCSQKDSVDMNCFSFFVVVQARFLLTTKKVFTVPKLSEYWEPTSPMKEIPSNDLEAAQLLEDSRTLLKRFQLEFDHYFVSPDSDQILMMVFHPLMLRKGFP